MKRIIIGLLCLFALNIQAQDDKTVTLVVSGQGKTQDEAKQNALRSAIEQAFGTFISSETVINNDSFISDNITSLSQGSILKFEILSSNDFPDNSSAITLKATVSISQMQKLTESKGHLTVIEGGLFGMNLKIQKLQSIAEEKAIMDMCKKSLLILDKSIDFNIEVLTPKKSDLRMDLQTTLSEGNYKDYWGNYTKNLSYEDIYKIRMIVECKPNSNLDLFIDYFINTLNAVKMSETEINFARQSGSNLFKLSILNYGDFYFRNPTTLKIIKSLSRSSTLNLVNYKVISNKNILNYSPLNSQEIILNQDENYELLKAKRSSIDIIDSSRYVLIHKFLNERTIRIGGSSLDLNYPFDFNEIKRNCYGIPPCYGISLYRTNSGLIDRYGEVTRELIYHFILMNDPKPSIATENLNNMNLRYQVLDYYLPLSDVEKLDSIRIIRKN
jgi:hypothetical protein